MRLVMIDNYDSFTYNLVQLFSEFNLEVLVFRHDAVTLAEIEALKPAWLCISPGPKAPAQAGISKAAIAHFYQRLPILGVCLGHQAINEVFGGATVRAPEPVHGKTSRVFHQERGLFEGLPSPFAAARYHSLMADSVAPDLEVDSKLSLGDMVDLLRVFRSTNIATVPELTMPNIENFADYMYEGYDYGSVVLPTYPQDQQAVDNFLGLKAPPGSAVAPGSVTVSVGMRTSPKRSSMCCSRMRWSRPSLTFAS